MAQFIQLEKGKIYGIPMSGGHLRVDVSCDPEYPGLDVEFIPDGEDMENDPRTRPRVLVESTTNTDDGKPTLRALVWADAECEDYTEEIEFQREQL